MINLKEIVFGVAMLAATLVQGQEYDYVLRSIFETPLEDYILLRLNSYRSGHGVAPLGRCQRPDGLQIANEGYVADVIWEEDSLGVDSLYEEYFNTDGINSAPGCIAYNDGGLTFTQTRTITFRKKDYLAPAEVPTEHELIEQWSEPARFDELVTPDSVDIVAAYLAVPDFAEVLATGEDTAVQRYVSIARSHSVNDVVKLRETGRKVVYGFELRYVINLVLYAKKK